MTYQLILFDRANGLAWITLNRPERLIVSSNAFERMRHFPVHGGGKGDVGIRSSAIMRRSQGD